MAFAPLTLAIRESQHPSTAAQPQVADRRVRPSLQTRHSHGRIARVADTAQPTALRKAIRTPTSSRAHLPR